MNVQITEVNVGKLVNGAIIPLEGVSFSGASFTLETTRTLRYKIAAEEDFEGIEVFSKFDGEVDNVEVEYSPKLDADLFELQSNFDKLKSELWFSITERNPGTQDFIGSYELLTVKLSRNFGVIHVWIEVE